MKAVVLPALLIFDLDGTLIDSGGLVSQLLNELREEQGKPPLPMSYFAPWLSLGGIEMVSNGLGVSKLMAEEFLVEFRRRYLERPTPLNSVFAGVHETLDLLRGRGHLMSLCTNKPRPLAEKVLRETGLIRYFASVCAGGDLPTAKPNVQNIRYCLDRHPAHASKAVIIGDSCVDQRLAAAADLPFVWFDSGQGGDVDKSAVAHVFEEYINLPEIVLKNFQNI